MNIRGGQLIQSNLNPAFPGTKLTGPILAGNILRTGGTNKAGLGTQDQGALGNVGYAKMMQAGRITQVAAPGFASPDLVIPAQSLIVLIWVIQLVAFNGASQNLNLGTTANPTLFTGTAPLNIVSSTSMGIDGGAGLTPPTTANWLNVGNQDVQMLFTSANAGAGVAIAIVEYIQGINAPTS